MIAFFDLCLKDEFACTLIYTDVPSYYTWDEKKFWKKRIYGKEVEEDIHKVNNIGRVYVVHPK